MHYNGHDINQNTDNDSARSFCIIYLEVDSVSFFAFFFLSFLSLTPESATVYLPLPVWLRRAKMGLAVLIRALGYPCECDSAYLIVIT